MKRLFAIILFTLAPGALIACQAEQTVKSGHYPIDGLSRDISQTEGPSVRGPQSVPPIRPGYASTR